MPGVERVKSSSSNKKWCRIQNWTMKKLKYQDRKTNKILTIYGGHHLRDMQICRYAQVIYKTMQCNGKRDLVELEIIV